MGLIEREEAAPDSVVVGCEILLLDEALKQMGTLDARNAEVVALRYFGGLSVEETATPLGVSEETMMRDWKLAKTRLLRDSTTRRVHDG
jgi:DNA-directed RNA polymerase specialized sigma24 family protein